MKRLLWLITLLWAMPGFAVGFTHVQGAVGSNGSPVSTLTIVLPVNPTTANIVCVGVIVATTPTTFTVKDSANNSYVVTTNSPSAFDGFAGEVYLAYLLSAPANATKTITATWTGGSPGGTAGWAEEFSVSGGTASFDKDAKAGGASGTTINTPTISPTATGSLLWSTASSGSFSVTAPTAGGTLGSWTGAAGGIDPVDTSMSEYLLSSASGSTAVQYTHTSGTWEAMCTAFTFTATAAPSNGHILVR